tara:strand:+ start:98 stop:553 length:456 start_codon:yes stop_codon:yes gene_type:complete
MGYKMKYTNGKKADTSAFPFKVEELSAVSDSPAKFANVIGGAERLPGIGAMTGFARGMKEGGLFGAIAGTTGGVLGLTQGADRETLAAEDQYSDVLASEGLERGFWGKLGFGGGKSKQRAARIKELQEQDQMGIDRERIESRGGVTAGAGA